MHGDLLNLMAHPLAYEAFYRRLKQVIHETAPGRDIKLVINEWNTFLPVPRQHSMESALYGARLMNVFERSSDIIAMTAVSDLVNGWPGGVIQASRHGVFVTPTYLVNKLYNDHLGSDRLATRVEGPAFDSTLEGKNVPCLDAVASRSADGREIFIKVVNTDPARPIRTAFKLARTQVHPAGKLEILTADSLATANSFQTPDAVRVRSSHIKVGANFDVDLPAHSVSVITLGVSQ
jgi:alpha-L-arabinofuranosidase